MVNQPTPLKEIRHPLLDKNRIKLFVKRDDLIHHEIMGNKWRKMKYNLLEAKKQRKDTILTMGGAHSNHIYSTAAAGEAFGFKTIGIIRGDELNEFSNDTLQFAASKGMHLKFIDRSTFRDWRSHPHKATSLFPMAYFLPEGGTNKWAIKGVQELVSEITTDFDLIACPIGTGGTFCGLLSGVSEDQHVLGVSALKGDFIYKEIEKQLKKFEIAKTNYSIDIENHFGGYGRVNGDLIGFMNWFKENFQIPLDPIYTGKCFFSVWNMIENGKFKKNLKIVLLHTGGLQGISGVNRKKGDLIK